MIISIQNLRHTHTRARAHSITAGLGSFPQEQRHKLHPTTRDASLGVSFPSRTRRGIREGTLAVGAWLLAPATPVFLDTRREMGCNGMRRRVMV